MNKIRTLALAAAASCIALGTASAAPITTPPPLITGNGDVMAYYAFADAADTSELKDGATQVFCNHVLLPTCTTANTAGDVFDLGIKSGALSFGLNNLSLGDSFTSDAPDADGNYHALITKNYSDFGEGALPAGIPSGPNVTYIGWEDKTAGQNSDFDYNDLIFAFTNTTASVPEPLTVSLVGIGLLGLVGLGRRRKKDAA